MSVAVETDLAGAAGTLVVHSWLPDATPKAALVICPGFNSHGGYYAGLAWRCAASGLAAHAVDLRGRGKSEGKRFHVMSFDEYVSDLEVAVSHARSPDPQLPLFLFGHSAGAVVACIYALDHDQEVAGLISESIAFALPAPAVALAILKALGQVVPSFRALKLKNADFSRDPDFVAVMSGDPLIASERQTLATVAALVRADELLRRSFSALRLPLLLIHGTADKAAKVSGSEYLFGMSAAPDKTLKIYADRYHDPLNDLGKEAVAADLLAWIEARLISPNRPAHFDH